MIILIGFIFAFSVLFPFTLQSQSPKISEYLKKVAAGKIDEVKMKLPDLLAEYPDDPGVMLLHGVVIEDAFRALEIYKELVRKYPTSQWADNAYWRIVQFYAVVGDTSQAFVFLEKFRQNFPTSEYLAPATDIVHSSIKLARISAKSNYTSKATVQQSQTAKSTINDAAATVQVKVDDKESDTGFFGLQVGIYRSKDKAQSEKEYFAKQRLLTEVLEKVVDDEIMYAVVIGNYTSRQSAENAKAIVEQQCNCKPIVFKK